MKSKDGIKDIKSVINEFYHKMKCEGKLTDCARECWVSYQQSCDDILQDLDRLEELEREYNNLQQDYDAKYLECCDLLKENQKLKNIIENINKLPNCYECDSKWHEGCMCLKKKINEVLDNNND